MRMMRICVSNMANKVPESISSVSELGLAEDVRLTEPERKSFLYDLSSSGGEEDAFDIGEDYEEEEDEEGGYDDLEGDWEEGSSITGNEFPILKRIANKLRYRDERGYFVGSGHWTDSVDMTAGQLLFRQQTPLNGVITVRQHGEFRALRCDRVLQSITLLEGEPPVPSARGVVFGYVRAMAAAAATFCVLGGRQSLQQQGTRLVCLGVGGGALPALFAATCPGVEMDAVDIDPVVLSLASQMLSMASPEAESACGDRLWIHERDAGAYIRGVLQEPAGGAGPPAVIFLDCYDNKGRVPRELTERAFLANSMEALAPGGAFVINHFNDEAGSPARRRLAEFGLTMLELCGEGRVFTVKVQNQAHNVIMIALKPEVIGTPVAMPSGKAIRQAAIKAGAAAGFTFDVAAELSELFRVVLEHPEDRFSEESM